MRRCLRFGIRLGLLGGLAIAIVRLIKGRQSPPDTGQVPEPFTPIPSRSPTATGIAGTAGTTVTATTAAPSPIPAPTVVTAPAPDTATGADGEVGPGTSAGGENQTWVEPTAGACPPTHPIKGKLRSKLYHLPGMLAYDRTLPDRCYADEEAAEADGFTKAKR